MTENQLSQLLDLAGDYCSIRVVYDYEAPNSVTTLFHSEASGTDFFVTVSDSLDFARVYFYDAGDRRDFQIHEKDGHIDWVYSSIYLRRNAKSVLDIPISLLYLGVRKMLSLFEDEIPF